MGLIHHTKQYHISFNKINEINISNQFDERINTFISYMTVLSDKRLVLCTRTEIQILQLTTTQNTPIKLISIFHPHQSISPPSECVSSVTELSPNIIASTGYGCPLSPSIKIWKLHSNTYEQIGSVYGGYYIKCILHSISNDLMYSINSKAEIVIWNKRSYQVCTYIKSGIDVILLGIKLMNEDVLILNDLYDNLIKFDLLNGKSVGCIEDICCSSKRCVIEIPKRKIAVGGNDGIWVIDVVKWVKEYKFVMNLEQIGSLWIDNEGIVFCGFKKGFHYRNFEACISVLMLNKRDKFVVVEEKKITEHDVTGVDVLSPEIVIVSKVGVIEIYNIVH